MKHSFNVEAALLSSEHPYISKHTSVFSILVSSVLALLGVAAVSVSVLIDVSSVTMSMALLTLGMILILVALYRFFWKCMELIYIPTCSVISEGSCYMDSCELSEMIHLVENKNFSLSSRVMFKHSGNGRMDYLISKDRQFAAVQLFRFVPYAYEPATQVYYYTGDDAIAFVRYLSAKNN